MSLGRTLISAATPADSFVRVRTPADGGRASSLDPTSLSFCLLESVGVFVQLLKAQPRSAWKLMYLVAPLQEASTGAEDKCLGLNAGKEFVCLFRGTVVYSSSLDNAPLLCFFLRPSLSFLLPHSCSRCYECPVTASLAWKVLTVCYAPSPLLLWLQGARSTGSLRHPAPSELC